MGFLHYYLNMNHCESEGVCIVLPCWMVGPCGAVYFVPQAIFVFLRDNLSGADTLIIVLNQQLTGPLSSSHMLLGGEQGCFKRGIWCQGAQHLLIRTGQSRRQQNGRVDRLRARHHPGHLRQDGLWDRGPCSSCQVRCTSYFALAKVYWRNLYDTLNKTLFKDQDLCFGCTLSEHNTPQTITNICFLGFFWGRGEWHKWSQS